MEGPPLPAARLATRHAGRSRFWPLAWLESVRSASGDPFAQSRRLSGSKGVLRIDGLVAEPLRGSVGEAQAAVVTRPIAFDQQRY
jgi:hypothetical protein